MKRFSVVYADPPWKYRNARTGGSTKSGAVQKYDVLTLEAIRGLPVAEVVSPDSVLLLWATVPLLPGGLLVMESWGFRYKTAVCWNKTGRLGMGFWLRGSFEVLLVGTRGKVRPPRLTRTRNVLPLPVGIHSEKPAPFRYLAGRIAEGCFGPSWSGLELFARTTDPRWTSVGMGIDGRRVEDVLREFSGPDPDQDEEREKKKEERD